MLIGTAHRECLRVFAHGRRHRLAYEGEREQAPTCRVFGPLVRRKVSEKFDMVFHEAFCFITWMPETVPAVLKARISTHQVTADARWNPGSREAGGGAVASPGPLRNAREFRGSARRILLEDSCLD